MLNTIEDEKTDLVLKEQKLKVEQLECIVADLKKPGYKKLGFWTSSLAVLIALGSVVAQNYLSSFQRERLNKEMAEATDQTNLAKHVLDSTKSMSDSLTRNNTRLAQYNDSL